MTLDDVNQLYGPQRGAVVLTRSGKEYWLSEDQWNSAFQTGFVWVTPMIKQQGPFRRRSTQPRFVRLAHLKIKEGE
jgi:hypothetical protein